MFVSDFVRVDQPFEEVAPRFVRDPAWLDPLVSAAAGATVARCERGTVRRRAESLVVPMRWAVEHDVAFPGLDGDLTIAPLGPTGSRLGFDATYTLPARRSDERTLTQEAVELSVRSFLVGLAAVVQTPEGSTIRPWK